MPPATAAATPILDPADYGPSLPGTEFELDIMMAFQPVVDLERREILSYEALARGPNGKGEATVMARVTPQNSADFDRKCRAQAIEMAAVLGADVPVSINFFPGAVDDPEAFVNLTLWMAEEHDVAPDQLMLEYAQAERPVPIAHMKEICRLTRRARIATVLDDFGAGFAGISRLAVLRPSLVKLDQRLVHRVDTDPRRRAILSGLQAICLDLGIGLVAKGVETAAEVKALTDCGLTLFQGNLFSEPAVDALVGGDDIAWAGAAAA